MIYKKGTRPFYGEKKFFSINCARLMDTPVGGGGRERKKLILIPKMKFTLRLIMTDDIDR